MKRKSFLLCIALALAAGSLLLAPSFALIDQGDDDTTTDSTSEQGDEEVTPETLEKLSVPGEPHELLASTVGEWNLTIRVWPGLDSEPAETSGTASARWILGDRFVETVYRGQIADRPFEGLKIEGYENSAQEYVSTWRDNLGTYTLVFRGRCFDTCLVRTMMADFRDPISKQVLRIKGVTTIVDTDSYKYESFILSPGGTEFKNMELEAERRSP